MLTKRVDSHFVKVKYKIKEIEMLKLKTPEIRR